MSQKGQVKIQRDWLAKVLAAFFLGFTFATVCAGIFLKLTPEIVSQVKVQLSMWLMIPIWLLILSCCCFFRKGSHAWVALMTANILVYVIYQLLPDILI